jgi:hypothetical protein
MYEIYKHFYIYWVCKKFVFIICIKKKYFGKPPCKGTIGRPKHMIEDNIKMVLSEIGYRDDNFTHLSCVTAKKVLDYLNNYQLLNEIPVPWNWLHTSKVPTHELLILYLQ